jgi:hypothetical protein
MKIKRITPIGKREVYDISVDEVEHYVLENGVITHNTGIYYSSNAIFIIGRQQEKDADGVSGFNFVINIEKSRKVREKKKITISVNFGKGIDKWSGLLDIALESGHVIKPKNGWYAKVDKTTGEVSDKNYREAQTHNKDFWDPILNDPTFEQWINENYGIAEGDMITEEEIDAAMVGVTDTVEDEEENA